MIIAPIGFERKFALQFNGQTVFDFHSYSDALLPDKSTRIDKLFCLPKAEKLLSYIFSQKI